jgi:hypothetical protein
MFGLGVGVILLSTGCFQPVYDWLDERMERRWREKHQAVTNDLCFNCGHSFVGNVHGPDQNDMYMDELNKLQFTGTCTYCRTCNPRIFDKEAL